MTLGTRDIPEDTERKQEVQDGKEVKKSHKAKHRLI